MTKDEAGRYRWKWDLFNTCLGVHGVRCGSSDPIRQEPLTEMLVWLKWRLENWQPSIRENAFDDAAKALLIAAIADAEQHYRDMWGEKGDTSATVTVQ